MRKIIISALVSIVFLPLVAHAQPEFPETRGYVSDFANVISDTEEQRITGIIEEILAETSAEIAVVTVESMNGYDANYYTVELGRTWGVGNKERDDGVVFLTSIGDRETYIATGYGVEGYITDAQAFWITDNVVVPYFKNGDFGGGILAGVEKIRDALLELEPLPEGGATSSLDDFFPFERIIFLFFFFISIVIPWLVAVLGRSERWWPGGIAGGVIGLVIALIFAVTLLVVVPFALFGFLIDYVASKNYQKGKNSWWTGGGSSGWGGGSSSGGGWGGSSGGGFGGFSGGSFGGGGGGSSW